MQNKKLMLYVVGGTIELPDTDLTAEQVQTHMREGHVIIFNGPTTRTVVNFSQVYSAEVRNDK